MQAQDKLIAKLAKLSDNQITVLHYLHERGGWPGGDWYHGSQSQTFWILESLVRRGYVTKREYTEQTGGGPRGKAIYNIAPGIYEPK